jgi:hypothetical protein
MKRLNFIMVTIVFSVLGILVFELSAKNEKFDYGTIGEGYSAHDLSQGINVAWRMFTIRDIEAVCATVAKPSRLITKKKEYVITVSDIFSFNDLAVVAVDTAGKPLKPIPIIMEMSETNNTTEKDTKELIDIEKYKANGGGANVRALRPGTFHIRIRTLCTEPDKPVREIIIKYTILPKK